jgi:hypothetical protein
MSDADPDRTRLGTRERSNARQSQLPCPTREAGVPDRHPDHGLLRELEPAAERTEIRAIWPVEHDIDSRSAVRALRAVVVAHLSQAGFHPLGAVRRR